MQLGDQLGPTLRLEPGAVLHLHELIADRRDDKALGLGVGQRASVDVQTGEDAGQRSAGFS